MLGEKMQATEKPVNVALAMRSVRRLQLVPSRRTKRRGGGGGGGRGVAEKGVVTGWGANVVRLAAAGVLGLPGVLCCRRASHGLVSRVVTCGAYQWVFEQAMRATIAAAAGRQGHHLAVKTRDTLSQGLAAGGTAQPLTRRCRFGHGLRH